VAITAGNGNDDLSSERCHLLEQYSFNPVVQTQLAPVVTASDPELTAFKQHSRVPTTTCDLFDAFSVHRGHFCRGWMAYSSIRFVEISHAQLTIGVAAPSPELTCDVFVLVDEAFKYFPE
jgi:hypothetical protein